MNFKKKWNSLKLENHKLLLNMGNTTVKRSKSSDSIPNSVHPFDCVPKNNNFVDKKLILMRNYTPQYEQFHKKNSFSFDFEEKSNSTNDIIRKRMNLQYDSVFEEIKKKYIPNYDKNDTIVNIQKDKHCIKKKVNKKKSLNKIKRKKPKELKVYKPKAIYAINNSYTSESSSSESSKRNSINQNNDIFNTTINTTINDSDDKINNEKISEKSSEKNNVSLTEKQEMKIPVLEKYSFYSTKKYLKDPNDELKLNNTNFNKENMDTTYDSSSFNYPLKKDDNFNENEQKIEQKNDIEYPLSIIDILNESKNIQNSTVTNKKKSSVDDLIDKPIIDSSSSDELCYNPFDENTLINEEVTNTIEQLNNYMIRLKQLYIVHNLHN